MVPPRPMLGRYKAMTLVGRATSDANPIANRGSARPVVCEHIIGVVRDVVLEGN